MTFSFEENKPLTEEQYLERVHAVTEELFRLLWISNLAGTDKHPDLPVDWADQGDMYGVIERAITSLNPDSYPRFLDSCEVKVREDWTDPKSR